MNTNQLKLIEKYKPTITPGCQSPEALHRWLENTADVEKISLTEFSDAFVRSLYLNAFNAVTNHRLRLAPEEFTFLAYRLLPTEKNKAYTRTLQNTHEKFIHAVFEEKTGYLLSNSPKLHLELVARQGISQYDYDNNTDLLIYYLICLDQLAKGEY